MGKMWHCFKFVFLHYRHARKHFSTYEEDQLQEIQHCMALLAFPANTGNIGCFYCKFSNIQGIKVHTFKKIKTNYVPNQ